MKRDHRGGKSPKAAPRGPSQRQLRAGELVRHALVDILRDGDLHDALLQSASVTVTEVRLSPDFKQALCFVEPLGGTQAGEVVAALNRHARYLRGRLGREIELRFTPELRFVHDESFAEAQRMAALFDKPEVRRDLGAPAQAPADGNGEGDKGSPAPSRRDISPGGGGGAG